MKDLRNKNPFIKYLYSLNETGNRGALADLRRGLSGPPGTSPAMFQYVAPWVPDEARNTWRESVCYIVAGLFSYYQAGSAGKALSTDKGDFGDHCRNLKDKQDQSASFEARFSGLLKAHRDDLPVLLQQIMGLLKGEDIPINWDQLFYDLQYWNASSQFVQRNWANGYWKYQPKIQTESEKSIEENK